MAQFAGPEPSAELLILCGNMSIAQSAAKAALISPSFVVAKATTHNGAQVLRRLWRRSVKNTNLCCSLAVPHVTPGCLASGRRKACACDLL
jgi:hypothetical protein